MKFHGATATVRVMSSSSAMQLATPESAEAAKPVPQAFEDSARAPHGAVARVMHGVSELRPGAASDLWVILA